MTDDTPTDLVRYRAGLAQLGTTRMVRRTGEFRDGKPVDEAVKLGLFNRPSHCAGATSYKLDLAIIHCLVTFFAGLLRYVGLPPGEPSSCLALLLLRSGRHQRQTRRAPVPRQ